MPPIHTKLGDIGRSTPIEEELELDTTEDSKLLDGFPTHGDVPKLEITEDYKVVHSKDECEEAQLDTKPKSRKKRDGPSTRQKVAFMQDRMAKLEKDNSDYLKMIKRLEKMLTKSGKIETLNSSDSDSEKDQSKI